MAATPDAHPPQKGIIYKLRAETDEDALNLVDLIPMEERLRWCIEVDYRTLTITLELEVRTLNLEYIRRRCHELADGQVMLETVQPIELYTGKRNESISDRFDGLFGLS